MIVDEDKKGSSRRSDYLHCRVLDSQRTVWKNEPRAERKPMSTDWDEKAKDAFEYLDENDARKESDYYY